MSFRILCYINLSSSFFNLCQLAYWYKLARNAHVKPYRYVPPQREDFLRRFGLKKGIAGFPHFGQAEIGVAWYGLRGGLRRNYGCVSMCSWFQF